MGTGVAPSPVPPKNKSIQNQRPLLRRVASEPAVDPAVIMTRFRIALDEAEAFVLRMPTEKIGLLFLKDDKVVHPDPDRLDPYTTHAGQKRGHWPTSLEISAAMFEHCQKKPPTS